MLPFQFFDCRVTTGYLAGLFDGISYLFRNVLRSYHETEVISNFPWNTNQKTCTQVL